MGPDSQWRIHRSAFSTMNPRKLAPLLVGALVPGRAAFSQELPVAEPESLGLSSGRLERIGSAVQQSMGDGRVAGVVTLGAEVNVLAYQAIED
jgi:hypothetical protein